MPRRVRSLARASLAISTIGLGACGESVHPAHIGYASTVTIGARPAASVTPRLFAPDSVWNAPVSPDAPIDPASPALVRQLAAEAASEQLQATGPYIETSSDSTPIYRVPADQPTVRVALDEPTVWWRASLQAALAAVPIPADARPAPGSDGHLTIYQPATDRLWELFQARNVGGEWHAAWGGAIENVSHSPGYYTDRSWSGAHSWWGSTASSLPVPAGTITIDELRRGAIDHALALAVPLAREHVYSSPAQRTDGRNPSPASLPEGAHLRLRPTLDLASLHLPPVTAAIALAAQRYGLIVRDQTGHAIGLFAEDPAPTGSNPYPALFEYREPTELLARFPWRDLELLHMDLHRSTG